MYLTDAAEQCFILHVQTTTYLHCLLFILLHNNSKNKIKILPVIANPIQTFNWTKCTIKEIKLARGQIVTYRQMFFVDFCANIILDCSVDAQYGQDPHSYRQTLYESH